MTKQFIYKPLLVLCLLSFLLFFAKPAYASLCSRCGISITYGYKYENAVFCATCHANMQFCWQCGTPSEFLRKLPDGRQFCDRCLGAGIFNQQDALRIVTEVRSRMRNELGIWTSHPIDFILGGAGPNNVARRNTTGVPVSHTVGMYDVLRTTWTAYVIAPTGETRAISTRQDLKRTIRILYGISKEALIDAAAHEITHDWMSHYFPSITDTVICEGVAEYVASRVNILYNNTFRNQEKLMSKDPIYGNGYRQILSVVGDDPRRLVPYLRAISGRR